MALNIPLPGQPIDTLLKSLDAGEDLYSRINRANPSNSLHPSADVENALYVEQLRRQYGENDPRYLAAKKAHELSLQGRQSLIDYRDVLNQTAGPRGTSTIGKVILERQGKGAQDIMNNYLESKNQPINTNQVSIENERKLPLTQQQIQNLKQNYNQEGYPIAQNNIINQNQPQQLNDINKQNIPETPSKNSAMSDETKELYNRYMNKQTTDEAARMKNSFAENIDKTRYSINPDDLTRFSGPKGTVKYAYEYAKALSGNPSPEFIAHERAITDSKMLVHQIRQFYGDSIQPSAMAELASLSNPSSWNSDPKVAKAKFAELNRLLDKETETYIKSGTLPNASKKLEFKDEKFKFQGNENFKPSIEKQDNFSKLQKINPQYTKENIEHTAKQHNISVDEVIKQLMNQSGSK